jgi:SpoIIAA-like
MYLGHYSDLKTTIMLNQIKTFKGNALALELVEPFTEADAQSIEKLFEEKLNEGAEHVNILIKVKDLSVMKHMDMKAFFQGELWGVKHFGKIGRCAVVAHSDLMKSIVQIENKALHLFNAALEEKYFDTAQLDEALKFISPNE